MWVRKGKKMKSTICTFFVIALIMILQGTSLGDEAGLRVAVRNGRISISSTQSTLSEILARLSQEIDMTINAYGAQEKAVVTCEIDGAGIAETLQKLVPDWNTLVFSREERSIEIGMKEREERNAPQNEGVLQADPKGKAANPSLTEEAGEVPGEEAAPPDEGKNNDSVPPEISNDENGDEAVDAEPKSEEVHEGDDAAADETAETASKSGSRRHGPWQF